MLRTDVISDDLWALIEPVMPDASGRRGRPWNDHGRTLEGIIWRFRTGSPWRDLPEQFGAWQSVAERHLRWSKDQTYSRVFAAVRRDAGAHHDEELSALLMRNSVPCCQWTRPSSAPTSTRPARGPGSTQGADASYTFSPDEPTDHAIGRSRGGLTTKIHALTDERCSPLTVQLTAGQAGDNPMLWPLLDEHRGATRDPFRLLADKAYSHNSTRERLRKMKISHTIPEKSDQIAWRKAKGSAGGRPPAFDPELYSSRNTVERGFNRLKHWRGIATRYDKYALAYLGGVTLASIVIHHRVRN